MVNKVVIINKAVFNIIQESKFTTKNRHHDYLNILWLLSTLKPTSNENADQSCYLLHWWHYLLRNHQILQARSSERGLGLCENRSFWRGRRMRTNHAVALVFDENRTQPHNKHEPHSKSNSKFPGQSFHALRHPCYHAPPIPHRNCLLCTFFTAAPILLKRYWRACCKLYGWTQSII